MLVIIPYRKLFNYFIENNKEINVTDSMHKILATGKNCYAFTLYYIEMHLKILFTNSKFL